MISIAVFLCVVLPQITRHPENTSILVNSSLVLYCEATGAGILTYQWKKDDKLLPNHNSYYYLVDTVSNKDGGSYFCEVSNYRGDKAISLPATVTVYGM